MGQRTFVVERPAGTEWVKGLSPREQVLWGEHAVFMDGLFDRGAIVLGGPLADGSGALLVMEGETEEEVRALLAPDPWCDGPDILRIGDVREWTLYFDARR